jgi:hypothetical protein
MIAKCIIGWLQRGALINSNLLGRRTVGDSHIYQAGLQVLDAVRSIACVPSNRERFAAIFHARSDKSIGQFWKPSLSENTRLHVVLSAN